MGNTERAVVEILADIKYGLESLDAASVYRDCEILESFLEKYPVDRSVVPRLKRVVSFATLSPSELSSGEFVAELHDLIGTMSPEKRVILNPL